MKKFINDVVEIFKDVALMLYFLFKGAVLCCYYTFCICQEHGGNLIRYVKKYKNMNKKNGRPLITPVTVEVVRNCVRDA